MKRFVFLVLMIFSLAVIIPFVEADVTFPQELSEIEDSAFQGDTRISGTLHIPSSVNSIGNHAFSGTSLFSLILPSSVHTLGCLDISNLEYIKVEGNTELTVSSLLSSKYVIAPSGTIAEMVANDAGIRFIPENTVVEKDGFYYQKINNKVTLLSAVDPMQLEQEVTIPTYIGASAITNVLPSAFSGCSNVRTLKLPIAIDSLFADCIFPSHIDIQWYNDSQLPTEFEIQIPPTIYIREDLPIRFEPIEYASDYMIQVIPYDDIQLEWQSGPNVEFGSDWPKDDEGWMGYTFEGYKHTLVPGRYYVKVTASSYTLPTVVATAEFSVVEGDIPPAPTVSPNKASFVLGEDIIFTIDTTGCEDWVYSYGWNEQSRRVITDSTKWRTTADINYTEYKFACKKNGIWSDFTDIHVEITY